MLTIVCVILVSKRRLPSPMESGERISNLRETYSGRNLPVFVVEWLVAAKALMTSYLTGAEPGYCESVYLFNLCLDRVRFTGDPL